MAKLPRVTNKRFASSAPINTVEEFGSFVATGIPNYTTNPATIQDNSEWLAGWTVAINAGNKAPYVQDMNAAFLVLSYQLSYLFEDGIPEWDAATTYYKGSYVQSTDGTGQRFISLQDNNTNHVPPASASNSFWQWDNPPEATVSGALATGTVPKIGGASSVGPANSQTLVAGLLSDNGTNVVIGGVANVNGLQFPDGTVQKKAAVSVVTNQNVVTGSRSFGSVFQNTTNKPIFVLVTAQGANCSAEAYTDSFANPTTYVGGQYNNGAGGHACVTFIVLPGNYYKILTNGGGTLLCWTEWS